MPSDAINWLTHSLPASCMIRPASCSREVKESIRNEELITSSTTYPFLCATTRSEPIAAHVMRSTLAPCPWGCSHRREPPRCRLPAEYSCQCLCNGEGCGGWGVHAFSQQIPEQWHYILLPFLLCLFPPLVSSMATLLSCLSFCLFLPSFHLSWASLHQ